MQTFTGLQYLQIDIANCYGLDKVEWIERLCWCTAHEDALETLVETAKHPLLMAKAIHAYRMTQLGVPSGHNMFLDATASGLISRPFIQ